MPYPVRCPVCRGVTKVDARAVGEPIVCPRCDSPFRAVPEARVRSALASVSADGTELAPVERPTSFLLGLTLLPFGLPFAWVLAALVTNTEPIFSVLVAVAVAACAAGLGLGVALTRDWSGGTRVKAILALALLTYGTGALLYALKKDWVEGLRKQVFRGPVEWKEYPASDRSFTVMMPGRTEPAESPLSDWNLDAVRVLDQNPIGVNDLFLVAHGPIPRDLRGLADDAWYDRVRSLVAPDGRGKLIAETAVRRRDVAGLEFAGHEFRLELPDGVTYRIVQVYRVRNLAYLLLVEGASLTSDHNDVRKFFTSFQLKRGN
jgi:hypothetical protein